MKTFVLLAVPGINLFIALFYIWQLITRRSRPALAMWVFFTLAEVMSLATYLQGGVYRWTDNILNAADVAMTAGILVAVLFLGGRTARFNRFDTGCLLAVAGLAGFWLVTQRSVAAHLGIQLVMVAAYVPVVKRMWHSRANTEPWAAWIALAVAPLVSLLTSKGVLAAVYAVRASVCAALLLALMARLEWMNRKSRAAAEAAR